MAEFTTERRRELTQSKAVLTTATETEFMDMQLNTSVAAKIKEDTSNNGVFRTTNSELTGLAYEYRYLQGKYHPALDEKEYYYYDQNDEGITIAKSYWDNQKLQDAGALKSGNEFHLNIREGTTVKFPIRPDKYASWVPDNHEYVTDFETTEQNMIAMVRTLDTWYTSGFTGTLETTIFGEYSELVLGDPDEIQPYMTVGYTTYQSDPNDGYMTPGFDKTGELILINGSDLDNFSFGKVVASRDLPSRILLVPYGKVGSIPSDANVTTTFTASSQIIQLISEQVIFMMKDYYTMINHYLENNPNQDDTNNEPIGSSVDAVLVLIDAWEKDSTRLTFATMLQLMTDIETERTPTILSDRIIYINSYLPASDTLYGERFDIIDLRITKNAGTLKEIMSATGGIEVILDIRNDREDTVLLHNKYFVVKYAIKDGDYYMRIFVEEADELSVGQDCYILTDNDTVPEIHATITEIVIGRIEDPLNAVYDNEGNVKMAYTECRKVFFGTEVFTPSYLTSEGFRIIREI